MSRQAERREGESSEVIEVSVACSEFVERKAKATPTERNVAND